tara:strand:- start:9344 stop:9619 length:276 start_codon:yes stop_codon:yes gene_type:complete
MNIQDIIDSLNELDQTINKSKEWKVYMETTKEITPEEHAKRKLERESKTLSAGTFIFHPFGNEEGYLLNTRTGEIRYVCVRYTEVIKERSS